MTTSVGEKVARVGDELTVETSLGELVRVTVLRVEPSNPTGPRSTRRKRWSRWSGTVTDLIDIVKAIRKEMEERSQAPCVLHITVAWKNTDEEFYSDLESFHDDLAASSRSEAGHHKLQDLRELHINLGPTGASRLSCSLVLTTTAPALAIEVLARDRVLASGILDRATQYLARGRPRIPAPNQIAILAIFFALGIGYSRLSYMIDFGFLPKGWVGDLLFYALYGVSYFALIYGAILAIRLILPPLKLASATSELSRTRQWLPRALKIVGAVTLAIIPFLLDRWFG